MGDLSGTQSRVLLWDLDSGELQTLFWSHHISPFSGGPLSVTAIDILGPGRLVFHEVAERQNLVEFGVSGAEPQGSGLPLTQGSCRDRQPAYAPDGERIVLSSNRSGNLDLFVCARATGALRQLTDDPAQTGTPPSHPMASTSSGAPTATAISRSGWRTSTAAAHGR